MTFSRDDPRERVTVRIKDKKKKELKDLAETKGLNMSDILRDLIDKELGHKEKSNSEVTPPVEEDLSRGWHILCRLAGDNRNINAELAKNVLSQEMGKSQDLIEAAIIKPLANRGYLTVKPRLETVVYNLRVYYNE